MDGLVAVSSTQLFDRSTVVLGAMLVVGALIAGVARRSFLSLTAVFVLAGFVLGHGVPAVLAFAAALNPSEHHFVWWQFVLQNVSIGFGTGLLVGFIAAKLMPRSRALRAEISPHQKALYALGVAFLAYGLAVLPPKGNGLIATYVCAIVLGSMRQDIRASFEGRSEDLIEVVKLAV